MVANYINKSGGNLKIIIVKRNGKIAWKHGPNRSFLHQTWVPKIIRTQSTSGRMKYKQKSARDHKLVWSKRIFFVLCADLRMSEENCLIFNWHSSRAAPGISFFGVPAIDNEYCTNWRNNIVAVTLIFFIRTIL